MRKLFTTFAGLIAIMTSSVGQSQTTKPPPPTGALPITQSVLDAGSKVVGMWYEEGWIYTRAGGAMTRIFARPDPTYVTNLRLVEGPGLFFTTSDCSGTPYISPNGPEGVRGSSTLLNPSGRWNLYVAQPAPPAGFPDIEVFSFIQDGQPCRPTQATQRFQPTQASPILVDSLFTEPYRLQPASTSTKPKDAKNLQEFTTIVDSANRIVGRASAYVSYITLNGILTSLPLQGNPANPDEIKIANGFGLYYTTSDCTGQAYVLGHHEGVWGVQPSTTYKRLDGRWEFYRATNLALTPLHYFSGSSEEGGCSTADDTKVASPVGAPVLLDTLFTEPFHLQ